MLVIRTGLYGRQCVETHFVPAPNRILRGALTLLAHTIKAEINLPDVGFDNQGLKGMAVRSGKGNSIRDE